MQDIAGLKKEIEGYKAEMAAMAAKEQKAQAVQIASDQAFNTICQKLEVSKKRCEELSKDNDSLREKLEATRIRLQQVVTYVPQTPPRTNYPRGRRKSSSP